jgi:hypothetical protein
MDANNSRDDKPGGNIGRGRDRDSRNTREVDTRNNFIKRRAEGSTRDNWNIRERQQQGRKKRWNQQ